MKWLAVVLVAFVSSVVFSASSFAETTQQLLITEVRLGGASIALQGESHKQYVSVHNPGQTPVDLTGWQLQYAKTSYVGDCAAATWSSDMALSGSVSAGATKIIEVTAFALTDNAAGGVRVIDQNNVVYDTIGWGNAPCYESHAVSPTPSNDKSVVRYLGCDGTYDGVDTNDNAIDFISNQVAGSQIMAPECTPVCASNQQLVDGKCVDDQCDNVDGFQAVVPIGDAQIGHECQKVLPLQITEVLPNVSGSDTGKEFIELFNPNDSDIDLSWYRISINGTIVSFPNGTVIAARSYTSFSDTDLGLSLLNTTTSLLITSVNGDSASDLVAYKDPDEDMSWAIIGGVWQYTSRPTPGAVNQPSPVVVDGDESATKPCPSNQHYDPDTGRCRRNVTQAVSATCKQGQVRDEETNRCRKKTTLLAVKPCKDGQYRSEETNRCRSIAADTKALAACRDGQERNLDTNRCRNVAAVNMDAPGYKIEPLTDTSKAFVGWWVLGGAGALALGRIGWEWRAEMSSIIRKMGAFFTSGK